MSYIKKLFRNKKIVTIILIISILLFLFYIFKLKFANILPTFISIISTILPTFISIISLPIITELLKFFKLNIYLANQLPLMLYFNKSGSYLRLRIAMHSQNKPCIINDIKLTIFNNTTDDEFEFKWGYFLDPSNVWASDNGIMDSRMLNISSFARPIEINADSTRSYEIEFYTDDQKEISKLYDDLSNNIINTYESIKSNNKSQIKNNKSQIKNMLTNIRNKSDIRKKLENICKFNIWKTGEYIIYIKIFYNNNKSLIYKFKFNVSEKQASNLNEDYIFNLIANEILKTPIKFTSIGINELTPLK